MQSKTSRGVRHLLVSTGVVSLVLSVAAPAAVAQQGAAPASAEDERKEWVCHATASEENPWEFNLVSVNAQGHDTEIAPAQEAFNEYKNKAELLRAIAANPGLEGDLVDACDEAAAAHNAGGDGTDLTGDGTDLTGDGTDLTGDGTDLTGDGTDLTGDGTDLTGDGTDLTGDAVTGTPTGSDSSSTPGNGVTPVVPAQPATPALPEPQPRPVVVISTDTVTRPTTAVPAVPASPAAPAIETSGSAVQNEVLGSVTTRTPSAGVGAPDPGARTSVLAATGFDHTSILAALGSVLLLSGLALTLVSRTWMRRAA